MCVRTGMCVRSGMRTRVWARSSVCVCIHVCACTSVCVRACNCAYVSTTASAACACMGVLHVCSCTRVRACSMRAYTAPAEHASASKNACTLLMRICNNCK